MSPLVALNGKDEERERDSPGGDLPDLDGFITTARDEEIASGEEGDAAHVVIMPLQRLAALERVEIPQFDGHVRAARGCCFGSRKEQVKVHTH